MTINQKGIARFSKKHLTTKEAGEWGYFKTGGARRFVISNKAQKKAPLTFAFLPNDFLRPA